MVLELRKKQMAVNDWDLTSLLMTKEQLWANHSGHSLKLSNHEQFPQVTHHKWANEQITRFLANLSFANFFAKKAICSENWWANSQPYFYKNKINAPKIFLFKIPIFLFVIICKNTFFIFNILLPRILKKGPLNEYLSFFDQNIF